MSNAQNTMIAVEHTPPSAQATLLDAEKQREFFRLEEIAGYGGLSRRERLFTEAIFAGCNQTQAARRAGVLGGESNVRAAGAKLAAKPSVRAVIYQAWAKSGANIDDTVRQASAIAGRAFADWMEGESPERRAAARAEWQAAAALLASIHGRLGIKVEGSVNHEHRGVVAAVTVPAAALHDFAVMRRDALLSVEAGRAAQ